MAAPLTISLLNALSLKTLYATPCVFVGVAERKYRATVPGVPTVVPGVAVLVLPVIWTV